MIDSPHTRGAPQPRYRIFAIPTVTISGGALGETLRREGVHYGEDGA
jgi:hypothetical protein